MPKNIYSYTYKDADSGLNTLYHEFGTLPARLQAVIVGRDPISKEARLTCARLSLIDRRTGYTSDCFIGEQNGINVVYFNFDYVVQAPECLMLKISAVALHDNIWFKVITFSG